MDFPTGGIILSRESIVRAYATGRGKFLVRAKAGIEAARRSVPHRGDRIPVSKTNKSSLLERIAERSCAVGN